DVGGADLGGRQRQLLNELERGPELGLETVLRVIFEGRPQGVLADQRSGGRGVRVGAERAAVALGDERRHQLALALSPARWTSERRLDPGEQRLAEELRSVLAGANDV